MEKINQALEELIITKVDELHKLPVNSTDFSAGAKNVIMLAEHVSKNRESSIERSCDKENKLLSHKEDKRKAYIQNAIDISKIIVPSLLVVWGTMYTVNWEDNGGIMSFSAGRKYFQSFTPKTY